MDLVNIRSKKMQSYSKKMAEAIANQDTSSAQLHFEKALEKDTPEELGSLGEHLFELGFLEEAQTIFSQLLEKFPEAEELHIPLAEIAIENNEIDEAFTHLEAVPKQHPVYIESLLVLADLYQVLGLPEVSELKLKEAKKILLDEPLLDFALAELYFNSEKFSEALDLYLDLIKKGFDQFSEVALSERVGVCYSMAGNFEEAVPYLEAALTLNRSEDHLFQLAFTFMQMHENQKAIVLFQELKELSPTYQSLYLYLGDLLQEEGQLAESLSVLEEGIEQNPYQVSLYQLAAEVAFKLGKIEVSEGYLKKAVELEEDIEASLMALTNLYINEDRYEEIVSLSQKYQFSENPYLLWNLAHAQNELEEYGEAKLYYSKAADALGHHAEFLKEYGLFLREEGELEQARVLLTHYLEHEPEDLTIIELLAED